MTSRQSSASLEKEEDNEGVHQSLVRMYELAKEDGAEGPAALGRLINETTQAINNWGKPPGVSSKGAIKAQRICKWSAEYILFGTLPKRIKPSMAELVNAPVPISPLMVSYCAVKGKLSPSLSPSRDKYALLEEDRKDKRLLLVFFDQAHQEGLEAYEVGDGAFASKGRVKPGEFIVVHSTKQPMGGDDVLIAQRDESGVLQWSLETFVATYQGKYLFDAKDAAKPIVFDQWRVVVALNSKDSIVRPPPATNGNGDLGEKANRLR